jgi:C_GCAxxG_C_C family probable redox protein
MKVVFNNEDGAIVGKSEYPYSLTGQQWRVKMISNDELKQRIQELAQRDWDVEGITARFRKMEKEGIPKKELNREALLANKDKILDRVQQKAGEYNYITKNCAQGTALALMEEFGQGSMEIIKALTNFPGIGGMGEVCGGITGSLINFGLFFGGDDPLNFEKTGPTMMHAQKMMAAFKAELGSFHCAKIQELIFGRNMDPGAGPENMEAFAAAQGFEKCGLVPGIGVRLAAEIIIDNC